ncbi:MAG: patatin-like phospholipase family protein [Actinomycetota bacterium]|nr:patatin-like phospholipase family protein [Actinomycetota bacterium]
MRFSIVLGAGGPKAWPFHAGVLRALADHGLPADDAALMIGTSAGAAVATATRSGATPEDIIDFITTPPSSAEVEQFRRSSPSSAADKLRAARPRAPRLLLRAGRGGRGLGVIAAGVLPAGLLPHDLLARVPRVSVGDPLPARLWIPAVRLPDGETVVFGRDVRPMDITATEAVQASSAVPWLFQAKSVKGITYVDGAVDSPTHADLALEIAPDAVIISSVMTRPGNRVSQMLARRTLAAETERVRSAGVRTVVVAVDDEVGRLLDGFPQRTDPAGARSRGRQIADAAAALTEAALV